MKKRVSLLSMGALKACTVVEIGEIGKDRSVRESLTKACLNCGGEARCETAVLLARMLPSISSEKEGDMSDDQDCRGIMKDRNQSEKDERIIDQAWGNRHPNPGSQEAREQGCVCPIIDNCHGRGCGRVDPEGQSVFWENDDCPLHGAGVEIEQKDTTDGR